MKVETFKEEDICLIYVTGELTSAGILPFEQSVKKVLNELVSDKDHPIPVLIDFSNVFFIDSSGVAAMVGVHLSGRHWLLELAFVGFRQRVAEMIERTKISEMLDIFSDEQTGRKALIDRYRLYQRSRYQVHLTVVWGEDEVLVECINLSKAGCKVLSKVPLVEHATPYLLIFHEADIEALAVLNRCLPVETGFECAFEFRPQAPFLGRAIMRLLEELPPL